MNYVLIKKYFIQYFDQISIKQQTKIAFIISFIQINIFFSFRKFV